MSINSNRMRFTFEGRSSLAKKRGSAKYPNTNNTTKLSDTKDKVSAKISNSKSGIHIDLSSKDKKVKPEK